METATVSRARGGSAAQRQPRPSRCPARVPALVAGLLALLLGAAAPPAATAQQVPSPLPRPNLPPGAATAQCDHCGGNSYSTGCYWEIVYTTADARYPPSGQPAPPGGSPSFWVQQLSVVDGKPSVYTRAYDADPGGHALTPSFPISGSAKLEIIHQNACGGPGSTGHVCWGQDNGVSWIAAVTRCEITARGALKGHASYNASATMEILFDFLECNVTLVAVEEASSLGPVPVVTQTSSQGTQQGAGVQVGWNAGQGLGIGLEVRSGQSSGVTVSVRYQPPTQQNGSNSPLSGFVHRTPTRKSTKSLSFETVDIPASGIGVAFADGRRNEADGEAYAWIRFSDAFPGLRLRMACYCGGVHWCGGIQGVNGPMIGIGHTAPSQPGPPGGYTPSFGGWGSFRYPWELPATGWSRGMGEEGFEVATTVGVTFKSIPPGQELGRPLGGPILDPEPETDAEPFPPQ